MVDFINTYSSSFKLDLVDFFNYDENDITNFLTTKLPELLNEDTRLKITIENFKKLKTFLGNKRKNPINEEDFSKNSIYFKNQDSLKNNLILKIHNTIGEDMVVEDIIGTQCERLTIFNKPIIFAQLFDSQTIDIDLINDHLYLNDKLTYFNQFDYKIYSISNRQKKLNVSNNIDLTNINNNPIKIENEHIYSYLFIINSKLPQISDSDFLIENIYKDNEDMEDLSP